ncbi:MAG: M48 family metallopeptidase [Opitutaceae bacterium]|nr:M48 family metallopeptidase [Cytophagales bacterium]
MRKLFIFPVTILIVLSACSKVAVTGRNQLSFIPASEMQSLSYTQYQQFLSENKVSTDAQKTTMVKNCGQRIQKAVEQYMAQNNLSSQLANFKWEFNLVEDPTVNAWCMPGGKVVVYTGILPVVQDETGLAVVLGHEIAHAIANHGGERMSQELAVQTGGQALSVALAQKPALTQQLFLQSFAIGSQVGVLLPYSRLHESEADHIGLIFMAMAGYDPNVAVSFWQRMKAQGGQKPPEFLSTHPADDKRIAAIQKEMPEAMRYYKK